LPVTLYQVNVETEECKFSHEAVGCRTI